MRSLKLIPAGFEDYRKLAYKRLPRQLFDYIDGGAYDERTMAANSRDFADLHLKQRVLRDISQIDTSTQVLGEDWDMPVALAPIGLAGAMRRRAEVQAAKAAVNKNIPFTLSTVGICSVEEVAGATAKPFWYQLYMMRDRGAVQALLERAKQAGCTTLVFTVDLAVVGARYRDLRNGMGGGLKLSGKLKAGLQYPLHYKWLLDVAVRGKPLTFGNLSSLVPDAQSLSDFKTWVDAQFDPTCTWKDIEWLRGIWDGKLIIKGVLSLEDAKAALGSGADGVIISNHGGRQLDSVRSTINVTADIADKVKGAAQGKTPVVLMDGGVRSGLDVVKALAVGADGVLVGRPWIYALAAQGQAGLETWLAHVKAEMKVAMALTSVTRIAEISRKLLDQ